MKAIKSEMAGTILELSVAVGDKVTKGQTVAIVESMKMEVPLESEFAGTVSKITKAVDDFVNEGDTLMELAD